MLTSETQPHDRLEEALAEYELSRDQGRVLDRRAFLARYADIAHELGPLLDAVEWIERFARPVREALGEPPPSVPAPDGYEILAEIGRGGMGVVFAARQTGTEQSVALKMLRPDWLAGLDESSRRQAIGQFRDEARAAACLRHGNRVRILHLGECQGLPYYAMELIEGQSLAQKLKRPGGVSKEAAVKYLASVADAVQEAHERGILHRDVKPHNILIDERTDEALLTDFGLAVIGPPGAEGEPGGRGGLRVAGTLPYMSPEQTQDADAVSPRSDVYSLGATLYETLTGAPPFTGDTRAGLIAKIREADPVPPRRLEPDVNRELERICLRCLHKNPGQRFGTARELAEALRGFMRGVRYTRNFTTLGTLTLFLGPLGLLLDLLVYRMLQGPFFEPLVWLLLFSHYIKLCPMILIAAGLTGHRSALPWRETWAIWGGHAVASVSIALAMRAGLDVPPRDIILLMYSVFAALSGMAYFIEASKMSWRLSWGPVGFWLTGVALSFHREAAPLYYGGYVTVASIAYGLYLRKLGKELR